jgi:hypothetical protein
MSPSGGSGPAKNLYELRAILDIGPRGSSQRDLLVFPFDAISRLLALPSVRSRPAFNYCAAVIDYLRSHKTIVFYRDNRSILCIHNNYKAALEPTLTQFVGSFSFPAVDSVVAIRRYFKVAPGAPAAP